jgi:4'-phosphopantetheinyl transferase
MTLDHSVSQPDPVISFISCKSFAPRVGVGVRLEARDIHVWSAEIGASASSLHLFFRWLDGAERSRAARFVQEDDRRRYVLAHGTLRAVLSRYLDCRPDSLQFEREAGGKPVLVLSDRQKRLAFSMTHSDDRMLIAVAQDGPVGIDLEQIRATVPVIKLAERFYRPAELARIRTLPPDEQLVRFYRYWVAKEAALKGQGSGLSSLHECEVGHESEVRIGIGPSVPARWRVQWLSCGTGWAGAVAFQGEGTVRVMSPHTT